MTTSQINVSGVLLLYTELHLKGEEKKIYEGVYSVHTHVQI